MFTNTCASLGIHGNVLSVVNNHSPFNGRCQREERKSSKLSFLSEILNIPWCKITSSSGITDLIISFSQILSSRQAKTPSAIQ